MTPSIAAAFIVNCICIHRGKFPVLVVQQGDRDSVDRRVVRMR
jgi:hypothetical protein